MSQPLAGRLVAGQREEDFHPTGHFTQSIVTFILQMVK